MRIITVNPTTGSIESIVNVRKEKIQEFLFAVRIVALDHYGRIRIFTIVFFQEVEVLVVDRLHEMYQALEQGSHRLPC